MSLKQTYLDAFNMLCGDKLGSGVYRTVYTCRIRDDLVVKVESDESRGFANVFEDKFWADHQHYAKVAEWLAPCVYLSPDARILLQRRCDPVPESYQLPDKLPAFLTDHKRCNFGLLRWQAGVRRLRINHPQPQHGHEEGELVLTTGVKHGYQAE